jgi:uncharacterized membrane-anchored protein
MFPLNRIVVDPEAGYIFLIVLGVLAALVLVFLIRFYIAFRMAKNRNRDPWPWGLVSFFSSPIIIWIILLAIGNDNQKQNNH